MEILEGIKEWAAVGVLVGGIIYGFVRKIFKKKHPTIDKDVKFSAPIYEILVEILFKLPATRTFIKQFHNGNEYYSGQKIQRLSISHEKCRPDVTPIKTYHDNIQVPTEVHDVIGYMEDKRKDWFWSGDVASLVDVYPELDTWQKTYGVKRVLFFRLHDKKTDDTIGLLGITFNHNFRLDITDIHYLTKKKKEIESEFLKV